MHFGCSFSFRLKIFSVTLNKKVIGNTFYFRLCALWGLRMQEELLKPTP